MPALPPLFVLALFFFSGFSCLIYEVVWLRMLVRVFGSTTFATSNVLAIFMAGLAAGAWLAGSRARRLGSPLRAYGAVELVQALAACAATWGALRLPGLISGLALHGPADSFAVAATRSAFSFAVLIVPTVCMGASLPLLAEHLERSDTARDRLALLYGVNTLGAVLGVLWTGFYSLGAWGETRTAAGAVVLNLLVGAAALAGAGPAPRSEETAVPAPTPGGGGIVWLMAGSGFCALALEVVWTRMMILLLGTSVYAFSAMLASYLIGIGAGSLLCARWLRSPRDLRAAFSSLQVLAALLIAGTFEVYHAQGLLRTHPSYLYSPLQSSGDFLALFGSSLSVVVPVTLVYGMLFPLAAAILDERGSGDAAGRLYAWNTLGSVAGSLACGFLLIPRLGTRGTLYTLCAAHVGLGALASPPGRRRRTAALAGAVIAALAWSRPDPFLRIIEARFANWPGGRVLFHQEGLASTVTGYRAARGETLLLINGIIVSGKGDHGRLMAHLPLALRPDPRRALVICLGVGNTFRSAVEHGVAVDLVELEPEVAASFARLWPDHAAYTGRPGVRMYVNDGRNFLLTARDAYDAVIVDGTPPVFSAGTVNLYSREFVTLAKGRLSGDGILALWVPLPCFESDFASIARNFTSAFPHTLAWAQPGARNTGILLMGSDAPLGEDPDAVTRRAKARGLQAANPWLGADLLAPALVVGDARLRALAASAAEVTDDRPGTEFPLGRFLRKTPLQATADFVLAR